ncbi:hypothetical protein EG878_14745 [Enterococcus faecalis]|nr:hypothetical protein EG878_14745 [Enterococcus faecalis]
MNTVQNKFKVDTFTTVRMGHKAVQAILRQDHFDKELDAYYAKFGKDATMVIYDVLGKKLYLGQGAYGLKGVGVALGQKMIASYIPAGDVSYYEDSISYIEAGVLQFLAIRMWGIEPIYMEMTDRMPEAQAHLFNVYDSYVKRINRMADKSKK